jgi:membrane-associated phospholipid phosphatase
VTCHRLLPVAALALVLALAPDVRADTVPAELRYDTPIDLTVTLGGAAAWLGSELIFKSALAPSTCRWCVPPGIDADVRDALKWTDTKAADTSSSILGFGLVPATLVGIDALMALHDDAGRDIGPDVLIIAEATVVAMDANQIVKFAVGRERPFVHALPPAAKGTTSNPDDNNLSFYSGHTTATFAFAVATGTVASMRGYRWAPIAWIVGPALAATTGYLRIAADKHYFTDVVTGAVVGSAFGCALPYLFHAPRSGSAGTVSIALGPNVVQLKGVW